MHECRQLWMQELVIMICCEQYVILRARCEGMRYCCVCPAYSLQRYQIIKPTHCSSKFEIPRDIALVEN
jgi:hypothetical protein